MTLEETKTLLFMISAAYQNFQVNELSPQMWHRGLMGATAKDACAALERHMKGNKFPPAISEILEGITIMKKRAPFKQKLLPEEIEPPTPEAKARVKALIANAMPKVSRRKFDEIPVQVLPAKKA